MIKINISTIEYILKITPSEQNIMLGVIYNQMC